MKRRTREESRAYLQGYRAGLTRAKSIVDADSERPDGVNAAALLGKLIKLEETLSSAGPDMARCLELSGQGQRVASVLRGGDAVSVVAKAMFSVNAPPGSLYFFPKQPDDPAQPPRPPIRMTDIGMEVDPCDVRDDTNAET